MSYTLTFSGQFDEITVNGNSVTSPYTLQNGDVIVAEVPYGTDYISDLDMTLYNNGRINCNGVNYDGVTETLNFKNTDIVLIASSDSTRTHNYSSVNNAKLTINYTEKPNLQIDINKNGTTVLATKGSQNKKDIDINVDVQPNLQTKNVSITENKTQEIVADSEYDGLNKVTITTNVQSYITVASESALPTTAEEGTIAIVEAS